MENLYSKLHNLYPLNKTLRFELRPIGKTKENIEKNGIISEDEHRAETYKRVKKYCDEYHKSFIERSLTNAQLNNLDDYYELFKKNNRTEKEEKEFNSVKGALRKEIVACFKKSNGFRGLFGKDLIESYLAIIYKEDPEKLNDVNEFKKFTTYFQGFNKNRENMYSDEEKSTAIAYRLINENLPTFINNMDAYKKVMKNIPEVKEKIYKELEEYIQVLSLDEIFQIDYYNDVLTETGIEAYNIIISGKSEEGNIKIKGLNEYINEFNQKNSEKLPKLKELYKQILSDKKSTSFQFDTIENDEELLSLIKDFYNQLIKNKINANLQSILEKLDEYDLNKIYINNDLSISNISKKVYEDWSNIQTALNEDYNKNYVEKTKINTEEYFKEKNSYFEKKKVYSIKELEKILQDNKISEYFKNYLKTNNIISNIQEKYDNFSTITLDSKLPKKLLNDEKSTLLVKEFLDAIKELQEFVKLLIPKDNAIAKDEIFYGDLLEIYENLQEIIPVYNKTRNYLTQKPYSTEKVKINFNCSTLLHGWDVNKEKDNLGVIFLKDNNYYLGIMNPYFKKIFDNVECQDSIKYSYQKMNYKMSKDVTLTIPKCSTQMKEVKNHFKNSVSDYILYNKRFKNPIIITKKIFDLNNVLYNGFKKFQIEYLRATGNEAEYKDALVTWIEFCKSFLVSYKSTAIYDFSNLKPANQYEKLDSFYNEVNIKMYKIGFVNISDIYIDELVENGQLYLFQIYNKDFSPYSKGAPNLHTLYWKALFDEENLKNVVYKLNGEAEIFYRKASIKSDKPTHPANQPINNKNQDTINKGRLTSTFEYDLIKDKRYTVDKFQFHVPITMNFVNRGEKYINPRVNKYLKENSDEVHILGIDRGERNLLYYSVINSQGKIVEQDTLNIINNTYQGTEYSTDYHNLLNQKEEERDKARKNWKTIENIKELKEGYMSQVINKITELLKKYKAIIVIEDLNMPFKKSRIEKQVYQKFEKMLIDKLNYLVYKKNGIQEEGGVLNAYQLTNQFKSFKKLGKQTGILFYIPAWNTSKIDPTTGFVNLFRIKHQSLEKSNEFVNNFEDIRFNAKENYFEFDINYEKFTDKLHESEPYWTICTYGNRIKTFRNKAKNSEWDNKSINLTEAFLELFKRYNINLDNIKEEILNKADSKFYNAIAEDDEFEGFTSLFKLTVQMRNSVSGEMEDNLISPVKNKYGTFFDTRNKVEGLPKDADANGAYNIARKGLMLIEQIKNTEDENLNKIKYNISNKEWLNYAQDKGNL